MSADLNKKDAERRLLDAIWMLAHDTYSRDCGRCELLWRQPKDVQDAYKLRAKADLAALLRPRT